MKASEHSRRSGKIARIATSWAQAMSLLWLGALGVGCNQSEPISTAQPPAPARSGKEIYEACLLCHSTREMQRGPILNGLPAWYVLSELRKYKNGIRGQNPENRSGLLMAAAVSILQNDAEMKNVANYIGSLRPEAHLKTVHGDAQRGRQIYARCLPCHGDRGQGTPSLKAPPINVQEDWYLLDQLRKLSQGLRGGNPRDLEAQIMRPAIGGMQPADFRDVVAYIASELSVPKRAPAGNVRKP